MTPWPEHWLRFWNKSICRFASFSWRLSLNKMPSSTLAHSTMYPVQAMTPGIEMCMFMMKSENVCPYYLASIFAKQFRKHVKSTLRFICKQYSYNWSQVLLCCTLTIHHVTSVCNHQFWVASAGVFYCSSVLCQPTKQEGQYRSCFELKIVRALPSVVCFGTSSSLPSFS